MSSAGSVKAKNPKDYRLPENIRPSYYKLDLVPCLPAAVFAGEVWIKITVSGQSAERFWLNAHPELDIKSLKVVRSRSPAPEEASSSFDIQAEAVEQAEEAKYEFQKDLERLEIEFPGQPAQAGENFLVYVNFHGKLNDDMAGFYRTKYISGKDGKESIGACTQFESVDARRCFPCFDEPCFKAIFEISVTAPKDLICVSNMPVARTEAETGFGGMEVVTHHFQPTPIMSSYLATVVIGEFDVVETKTSSDVLVRVFTPVGKAEQGKFALDVAAKSLEIYSEYFGTPYPLPKLDLLSIPDFAAGAMEGWGCTTYREVVLLVDPEKTSAVMKQNVCLTVAHEVAHQWFGNLSTMSWWSDLWLNESFATYLEYSTTDKLFPDWKVWDQFVRSDFAHTLVLDCLRSSHAIQQQDTLSRGEIEEIFDIISYCKGASVIRMLVTACTEPVFRAGMTEYMKDFAYRNTVTTDLWNALEKASGRKIGDLMEGWITQTGYPLVTVEGEPELDPETGDLRLRLSQKRFLLNPEDADVEDGDPLWKIPIHVLLPNSHAPPVQEGEADFILFEGREAEIRIPLQHADPAHPSLPAWFKLNAGQEGLYRVRYPTAQLETLLRAITEGELVSPVDQIGLLNDTLALCQVGTLNTVQHFLPLVESLAETLRTGQEARPDPNVWAEVSASLGALRTVLAHSLSEEDYTAFKAWAAEIFLPAARAIGVWDTNPEDPHPIRMLRRTLLSALVSYGDEETRKGATDRVKELLKNPSQGGLDGDLRAPALSAFVNQGGKEEFEAVLGVIQKKPPAAAAAAVGEEQEGKAAETEGSDLMVEQKLHFLYSLTATKDPELIDRCLELTKTDLVRGQDLPSFLGSLLRSRSASRRAWEWTKANWDSVVIQKCASAFGVTRVVQAMEGQSTQEMLEDLEAFFRGREVKGSERTIRQTLENVRHNLSWMKRELPDLLAHFRKQD